MTLLYILTLFNTIAICLIILNKYALSKYSLFITTTKLTYSQKTIEYKLWYSRKLSNSYAKESTVLFTLKLCNTKKAIVYDELQYMLLIDSKENLEHHVRHSLSWLNNVEDVMQYHEDFKSINSKINFDAIINNKIQQLS